MRTTDLVARAGTSSGSAGTKPRGIPRGARNLKAAGVARAAGVVLSAALAVAACSSGTGGSSGGGGGAAGTGAPGGQARSGELLALTYNVAGLPQGISGSNPSVYMPLIGPKLNDYDLVLTQEDFATDRDAELKVTFFHEVLEATTNHPHRPPAMRPPMGSRADRPTAFASDGLNMFSRFPVGPVDRVGWKNCFGGADTKDGGAGDCLAVKGFSRATVTFAPGVEVDVYNLHGEAGSTPDDVKWSASDYVELAAYMAEHSKGRAVLLGGDTNLHSDEEPDKTVWETFLGATGLRDVCRVVDCGADRDDIDKFAFRSNDSVTLEVLSRTVELEKFQAPRITEGPGAGSLPELNDGQLSDHEAVAARFRWTAR